MSYFLVVGGKNELRLEPVGVALAVADLLVENCLGVNIVKSKNFVKILLFFATKSCFFFCLFWFWKVAFSATFVPATHATLNHKYRRDLMKFNEFCWKMNHFQFVSDHQIEKNWKLIYLISSFNKFLSNFWFKVRIFAKSSRFC